MKSNRATRYVALLRGVNVGGRGKVAMTDLRQTFESLGYEGVATYIQSGNVIFSSAKAVAAPTLEKVLEAEFGFKAAVIVRTAAQMKRVAQRNPFANADVSKVHVGFMTNPVAAAAVRRLDVKRFNPEEVVVDGTALYFHLPNGMGRAKVPPYVDRQLAVPITVRNWNTVTKLVELSASV